MNSLISLLNSNNNAKTKKVLPLGISVQTKHVHPSKQQRQILYNIVYPGVQKELVKIKEHKKTGAVDLTWRIKAPKIKKSKVKSSSKNNKPKNSVSNCTKSMISHLANSNMNNGHKIRKIQNACKLI